MPRLLYSDKVLLIILILIGLQGIQAQSYENAAILILKIV